MCEREIESKKGGGGGWDRDIRRWTKFERNNKVQK